MEELSCSFTGHRVLSPRAKERLPLLLSRHIEALYRDGVRVFYCGGALGFDTLAALAVIEFRESHPDVILSMLLPCKDQDMKWRDADRRLYAQILGQANEIFYVAERYTPACMKMRNDRLALFCDYMIGYVTKENTGSSQTMRTALQNGRKVCNLADEILC